MLSRRQQEIRQILYRYKSSTSALEKIREKLESGPNFQDFIQDSDSTKKDLHTDYDGKLKKEKNEKVRLRLPPWLKTTIPIGERKSDLLVLTKFLNVL